MTTLTEGTAIGDVVLYEAPLAYARDEYEIVRDLLATEGIEAGTVLENSIATATAAVQTYSTETGGETWVMDGGTYRLGYKGYWTTPLAWNGNVAAINAALDVMVALSGGTAGDIVHANVGGDLLIATNTFTFLNTLGNVPEVILDTRLGTDATYAGRSFQGHDSIATTTVGELAVHAEPCVTGAQAFAILLEKVSLTDRVNASGEALRRAVLVRGPSIINSTAMVLDVAATRADAVTALEALGIQTRTEPTITDEGTPTG